MIFINIEDIKAKWSFKVSNKNASVDMWNSMAESFGSHTLPTFEDNNFLKLIEKNKMIDNNSIVLDVGCGAGSYALTLAAHCKKVIGIDLSPRMIEIAKERALKENITNVEFFCADWHEMDLSKKGYEENFDLVFAHMTPAVQSWDTFLKLSQASRGWCALSKPTRRVDPVSDEVKKLVGISEKRESSDEDIVYAFELLWSKGICPMLEYEKQKWNMKKNFEEAYGLYVNRLKTYRKLSLEEEEKVVAYLKSIAKDGFICEDVDTTITTMVWHI
ncbi:MAG: class I SAM-dependent methyltransferase [Lachnospiraceae bacterium]|nr:class I SAM-dependent methyltransferase [Lachnospiraceae bacterium]